jgi:hypothetical protein
MAPGGWFADDSLGVAAGNTADGEAVAVGLSLLVSSSDAEDAIRSVLLSCAGAGLTPTTRTRT